MRKYLIALLTLPLCFSFSFIQGQSESKKKVEKQVEVKVDDETGEMVKTIKMKIKDGNGEEKIMVWTGTNEEEMSDEMKEHMEDVQIMVKNAKPGDSSEQEISITVDDETGEMIKTVEIISEENGEKKVVKWQGGENDEMPDEIIKHMKEVKVIVVDEQDVKSSSQSIKKDKKVKYKIIENGNKERVIEWNGEGEMPKEIKEKLEKEGVEIKDGNVLIMRQSSKNATHTFIPSDNASEAKPKLGIMIDNHVDGVEINEVLQGSIADKNGLKTGDIIFKIDDKYIGSTLQLTDYLNKVQEGKQVKFKLLRNGKEKTLKLSLGRK